MPLLGIDLGTTNSVVTVDRQVRNISDAGRTTLPSVVAFLPNGKVHVGEFARRRRAIDCPNTDCGGPLKVNTFTVGDSD